MSEYAEQLAMQLHGVSYDDIGLKLLTPEQTTFAVEHKLVVFYPMSDDLSVIEGVWGHDEISRSQPVDKDGPIYCRCECGDRCEYWQDIEESAITLCIDYTNGIYHPHINGIPTGSVFSSFAIDDGDDIYGIGLVIDISEWK